MHFLIRENALLGWRYKRGVVYISGSLNTTLSEDLKIPLAILADSGERTWRPWQILESEEKASSSNTFAKLFSLGSLTSAACNKEIDLIQEQTDW